MQKESVIFVLTTYIWEANQIRYVRAHSYNHIKNGWGDKKERKNKL